MANKKDPNIYPEGWNRAVVDDIIRYYDSQKDVDLYNTDGHTPLPPPTTWVEVPTNLVTKVQSFLRKQLKSA